MRISKLILILLFIQISGLSQEYQFTWKAERSFNVDYKVLIDSKSRTMELWQNSYPLEHLSTQELSEEDISELRTILNGYNFPIRGRDHGHYQKRFIETTFNDDSSRVIFKGDTYRFEIAGFLTHTVFDSVEHKFYTDWVETGYTTDGNMYRGLYHTNDTTRQFAILGGRLQQNDYQLCRLILGFLVRDDSLDLDDLATDIEIDYPK